MLRLASKQLLGLTSREIPSQPVHQHQFGRTSCLWQCYEASIQNRRQNNKNQQKQKYKIASIQNQTSKKRTRIPNWPASKDRSKKKKNKKRRESKVKKPTPISGFVG
ncbi:hypothetical protein V6Z11_D04G150200 [Gossypium hirsutum]